MFFVFKIKRIKKLYKVVEVSNKTLKNDIASYKKLSKKRFTMSVHLKKEDIERRSDNILRSFENNDLQLKPSQYILFAKYVMFFGGSKKEEYLDKLQKMADFDIREEIHHSSRNWWQKLLKIDPDKVEYMPADKLYKKIERYNKMGEKLEQSLYQKTWLYIRIEKIKSEAKSYIEAYLNDKITIRPEDAKAFSKYVKVMDYPVYDGSIGDQALKKLAVQPETEENIAEEKTLPIVKESKWQIYKNKMKAKIVSLKENTNSYVPKIAVASVFIAGLFTMFAKKDSGTQISNVLKENKTEIKIAPKQQKTTEQNSQDNKTVYFAPISLENNVPGWIPPALNKVEKRDTVVTPKYDSKRMARINHHNHVLDMRLGASKKDENYQNIESQLEKGIFSLPDSLGKEDFAYAMEMYNAYGIECSLTDALSSTKKLSLAENNKITEDIIAAGETGLGVKRMAIKKYKGNLNQNSTYNRASRKAQKQHNLNMKQWRQAKRQASQAA